MNYRILIFALGTFAIGTDGFMIAGILPSIAHDAGVTVAAAGQLVTAFAVVYAVSSPILGALTTSIPRKRLLVWSLVLFSISNGISAIAPSFGWLFVSRITAALGSSLYTPNAMAAAVSLVADNQKGKALAIVNTGLTVATVLGVPFGTWIGSSMSWRLTFGIVAILGVIAALGVQLTLKKAIQTPPPVGLQQRLAMLGNKQIALVLSASLIVTIGGFTVYNYIAPILHEITHINPESLSWFLLLSGLSSVIGNIMGGYFSDRFGSVKTLRVSIMAFCLSLAAFSLLMIIPVGYAIVWTCAVVIAWGIAAWALNPPLNSHLIGLAPNAATVLFSLSVSVLYLGIGLAAVIGGLVLEYISVKYLGFVAGLFEVFALGILFLCSRNVAGKKESFSTLAEQHKQGASIQL